MFIINIYKKAQHRQDQTLTVLSSTLPATRSLPALKLSFVKVCFDRFANFLAFHSAFGELAPISGESFSVRFIGVLTGKPVSFYLLLLKLLYSAQFLPEETELTRLL